MKRHHGLDLLRIVAMALIVLRHGVFQSGVTSHPDCATKLNYLFGVAVNDITAIAVNCFVIITGFFLSTQEFRPKHLLSLWLTVLTYSLGVTAAWALLASFHPAALATELSGGPHISDWIRSVFPIIGYRYWFITLYFLTVLASPLLNAAVRNVSLQEGTIALSVLGIAFCVIPSFGIDFIGVEKGYSLYWFVFLYLTGAFLRRIETSPSFAKNAMGYLVVTFLSLVYLLLKKALGSRGIELTAPDDYNFLLTFIASVFAFRSFQALDITNAKFQRVIALLAPLMIGVYLFHDHILKHTIWRACLGIDAFYQIKSWIIQVPLRIAVLFAIGCIVEFVRSSLSRRLQK